MTQPPNNLEAEEREELIQQILDVIDKASSRRYEVAVRLAEWTLADRERRVANPLLQLKTSSGRVTVANAEILKARIDELERATIGAPRYFRARIAMLKRELAQLNNGGKDHD